LIEVSLVSGWFLPSKVVGQHKEKPKTQFDPGGKSSPQKSISTLGRM
jgi:hypothetical protein